LEKRKKGKRKENYNYVTGKLQLRYRKTSITLQENFNYVTGKLQLPYKKTSITLQENYNYVTGKLKLRYRKTTITLQENLNHSHERQLRTLDGIFGDYNWKINKIRAEDIFKAM